MPPVLGNGRLGEGGTTSAQIRQQFGFTQTRGEQVVLMNISSQLESASRCGLGGFQGKNLAGIGPQAGGRRNLFILGVLNLA